MTVEGIRAMQYHSYEPSKMAINGVHCCMQDFARDLYNNDSAGKLMRVITDFCSTGYQFTNPLYFMWK